MPGAPSCPRAAARAATGWPSDRRRLLDLDIATVLPPAARLTRTRLFREVARRGHRCAAGSLVLHLLPAAPAAAEASSLSARVGFVVSRQLGGAVARNRIRRRLRHLVRERLTRLPAGSLLLVRARPAAAEATYAVLGADLDRGLARLLDTTRLEPAGGPA